MFDVLPFSCQAVITIAGDWNARINANVKMMRFVTIRQAVAIALPAGRVNCKLIVVNTLREKLRSYHLKVILFFKEILIISINCVRS